MNPFKTVSIIGFGAVGSSLAEYFKDSDSALVSVWDRKTEVCKIRASDKLASAGKNFPESLKELGNTIFICTPDDQIAKVAAKFSDLSGDWSGYNFVHTSGSLSADILSDLKIKGAKTASMHPIQTFPGNKSPDSFKKIWISLQGDDDLLSDLEILISDFESECLRLSGSQKAAMHLAAVFASNYLVTLMSVVEGVAGDNDIDNSIEILKPIINQTVHNIFESGTSKSLTGPVARGDTETLKKHLKLLGQNSETAELYKQLGLKSVHIAEKSGRITSDKAEKLRELLSQ